MGDDNIFGSNRKVLERITAKKKEELEEAEKVGFREGYHQGLTEVFRWIEEKYISAESRPDRGTPQGEALLQLAREFGVEMKTKLEKGVE